MSFLGDLSSVIIGIIILVAMLLPENDEYCAADDR